MIDFDVPVLPNPFKNCKRVGDGIDPEVYHRQDAQRGDKQFVMSRSELMVFDANPNRWRNGYRFKDTDATEFGTMLDTWILDRARFDQKYIVTPETCVATKTCSAVKDGSARVGDPIPWSPSMKECKDWKKEHELKGFTVISDTELGDCADAMQRLMMDERISHYLKISKRQVFIVGEFHDKATGLVIPCKSLLDLEPDFGDPTYGRSLADYKTARNAAPREWAKAVRDRAYDVQSAFHSDMHFVATQQERETWYHIVQENVFPWQPARRLCSSVFVAIGRMLYISALKKYAECLAKNEWPSWDDAAEATNGWTVTEPEKYMLDRL